MDQCIHCIVHKRDNTCLLGISFLFGDNYVIQRRRSWDHLDLFGRRNADVPWVIVGDFNAYIFGDKNFGGTIPTESSHGLKRCMYSNDLMDMVFMGPLFTWADGRPNGVSRKIDRVIINEKWLEEFPNVNAIYLPPVVSNHCAILVIIGEGSKTAKPPFMFFKYWAEHEMFDVVLREGWNIKVSDTPMFILCKKLRNHKG